METHVPIKLDEEEENKLKQSAEILKKIYIKVYLLRGGIILNYFIFLYNSKKSERRL